MPFPFCQWLELCTQTMSPEAIMLHSRDEEAEEGDVQTDRKETEMESQGAPDLGSLGPNVLMSLTSRRYLIYYNLISILLSRFEWASVRA